jgi:hypothetical protein
MPPDNIANRGLNPIPWAVAFVVCLIGGVAAYQVADCRGIAMKVMESALVLDLPSRCVAEPGHCLHSPDVKFDVAPKGTVANMPCLDFSGSTSAERPEAYVRIRLAKPGKLVVTLSGMQYEYSLRVERGDEQLIRYAPSGIATQTISLDLQPGEYLLRPQPIKGHSKFELKARFTKK